MIDWFLPKHGQILAFDGIEIDIDFKIELLHKYEIYWSAYNINNTN